METKIESVTRTKVLQVCDVIRFKDVEYPILSCADLCSVYDANLRIAGNPLKHQYN